MRRPKENFRGRLVVYMACAALIVLFPFLWFQIGSTASSGGQDLHMTKARPIDQHDTIPKPSREVPEKVVEIAKPTPPPVPPTPPVIARPTRDPAAPRPVVSMPDQPIGQSCNQYLAVSLTFARAAELDAKVVLWGHWRGLVGDFDLDHMRRHAVVPFEMHDFAPHGARSFSSWSGIFCGVRHSYNFTRFAMRPSVSFRQQGETVIARLRQKAKKVVSIHMRFFEGLCANGKATSPGWVFDRDSRPCHRNNLDYEIDINRMCQVQLDDRLMADIHREWPETIGVPLGIYLSTDFQQRHYIDTFYDKAKQEKYGIVAVETTTQGTHMLADMWASTMADYYIAQPKSSCEPIIAHWRAQVHGLSKSDVAPQACFAGFGEFEVPLNKSRYGDC